MPSIPNARISPRLRDHRSSSRYPKRGCRRLMLVKADTLAVNGHRHMVVLVGVDSDDNLNSTTTFTTQNSCHSYLPEDGAPAR